MVTMDFPIQIDESRAVQVEYINHRGERAIRRVVPWHLRFDESEWHPGKQWLLEVWDVDKQGWRTFAMTGIVCWGVLAQESTRISP